MENIADPEDSPPHGGLKRVCPVDPILDICQNETPISTQVPKNVKYTADSDICMITLSNKFSGMNATQFIIRRVLLHFFTSWVGQNDNGVMALVCKNSPNTNLSYQPHVGKSNIRYSF